MAEVNTGSGATYTSVWRWRMVPTWGPWMLAPVATKPDKKRWVRFTKKSRYVEVEGGMQALPDKVKFGPVVPA